MFKKLSIVLVILLFMSIFLISVMGSPQPIGPYYDDTVFIYGENGLSLNIGISDGYILKIDDADAVVDDYCKLTASGVVGRDYSEVKTDLSLNLVENTTLSTWVGTESITTLGTIVTGIWEGTAIADGYIPNDITIDLATLATTLTIVDNESTDESNAILFTSGGVHTGDLNIESDGDLVYNPSTGTLSAIFFAGDGSQLSGVGAAEATALTIAAKAAENIDKGEVVYVSGATGQTPEVSLADNTHTDKHYYCGVAAETKTTGQTILIRVRGELTGLDTDGFVDADELYLSTAGALTKTKPTSGAVELVGYCSYSHLTLGKIVIMHHAAYSIHVPSGDDIILRMGDNDGAKKVYFKDYANNEVASVNSDGGADFNSLVLDTVLAIAEGGTNSGTALNNNRVMVSSGGAIVESVVTATELGRLDGLGGIIVTDVTACTDLEGTGLSIITGTLNWAAPNESIDSDAYVDGSIDHEHLNVDIITGWAADTLAIADTFIFHDADGADLNKITWTNLMGSIVKVGTIATGTWEATDVGLAHGGTGVSTGAMVNFTSILNTALYIGRDADNTISFATDNKIIFKTNGVANVEILSTGEFDFNAFSAVFTEAALTPGTAVAWNLGNSNKATLTPAQNFTITITAPSGAMNAQLIITQDGTGSRIMDEIITQADATVATTDVHTDTEIVDLTIDIPTGARIRIDNQEGTDVPLPLVENTVYWAIRTSENHIKFATTKANAIAGTNIDITDTGTGTHTVEQLVKWINGTLGVLTTAAGSEDIMSLTYKTADKQWYAQLSNDFY